MVSAAFDLGLQRAGWSYAWQCEIDTAARGVLASHFDAPCVQDVHDVSPRNVAAVDLVCGGFPCQDLSVAGKRAGLAGDRSGLWFEFHRVLDELCPEWVIIENVPGLLSSNAGRDFAVILRGLVELRYGVAWRVLDAQYFGVAQRRRRVFIVGHLGDGAAAQVLFESEGMCGDSPPCRETGQGLTPAVANGINGSGLRGRQPGSAAFFVAATLGAEFGRNRGLGQESEVDTLVIVQTLGSHHGRNDLDSMGAYIPFDLAQVTSAVNRITVEPGGPARLLNTSAQAHVAYNWQSGGDVRHALGLPTLQANQTPAVGVRRLTPVECERLQGFPDNWTAVNGQSDSARYRQLGNAVCVPVIEWLAKRILAVNA